jgi:hydrogenase maturation protein HypF
VERRDDAKLAAGIAPGLNQLGVFLPYSPLHHRLLQLLDGPLVATSANISGEPVLTDNQAVDRRLAQVIDGALHHNREIVRPADDSVFRVIAGQARPLRLGRGFAPIEHSLPFRLKTAMLAVGGQMKNTVALAWEDRIVISPHIGDLDSPRSLEVFKNTINDLQELYQVNYEAIATDAHPGYAAHRWAQQTGRPVIPVFHHHAHAASLGLEFPGDEPWLVFTWDGVGYGADDSLWGGEALYGKPGHWQRVASFRPFSIPGGDRAGREPWRSAAALCWEVGLPYSAPADHELMHAAWEKGINCPTTTAVGRLFDAAAALTGLVSKASFEGQGPMLLEAQASEPCDADALPLSKNADGLFEADWSPLIPMLRDEGSSFNDRASQFHATMAATLVQQALAIRDHKGAFRIGLSGGVFQNKRLSEQVIELCAQEGLEVFMPKVIPCNDGGLCVGQIIEAAALHTDINYNPKMSN